jgi:2-polyprenyl-3-methyl-5-hydroxy-6-metoxy-1,4-benzoquinol methylase
MVSHSSCPLCSSGKIFLHLKCADHLLSGEKFELFKCSSCGFIFTREHPDENNIGRYYESADYISHDDGAAGLVYRVYILVRKRMLKKKRRIVEQACHITKGKILDVGCGTGYFAHTMKQAGWDVTGIEPGKKAREYSSQKFGIDVIEPGQISQLPEKGFDCITLWHVLEHFQDPFRYAGDIKRLLKPGGVCLAALPNSSSSDALFYRENWAAFDVPRHLWHFTSDTFRMFIEKEGFKITRISTLPFDVFYISILSEKNKGTKVPFLKGMIRGSWFFVKTLFDKNKSSSLIYFIHHQ